VNPQIQARDISVSLGGAMILKDVTFSIEPGEFLAVLGGNGSGKTTLLKALLGLLPLSHGDLSISTNQIAYMPQRLPQLGSVPVSVKEFAAAGGVTGRKAALKSVDVQSSLSMVGMWPMRKRAIDSLSGGQQRLTMFARALTSGAQLLMLDEPSAGVDVEHQGELFDCLQMLKSRAVTMIYVTHELDLIEDLVDKVLVLERSKGSSVAYFGSLPLPSGLRADVHHHHDEFHLDLGAHVGVAPGDLSQRPKN